MQVTMVDRILFFLKENPVATNAEIAKEFDITENYAKNVVCKQRRRGWLLITKQDGVRHIEVLKPFTAQENRKKQRERDCPIRVGGATKIFPGGDNT